MVEREIQSKRRYASAFIIGTFVFLLVIGISYSVAFYQYTRVADVQGTIAYSLFERKSLHTFFGDNICLGENFDEISRILSYQGKVMDDLETKFGKNNRQVLERKKFYSVLLLEHLDYVNLYNEECEPRQNTILFFYSNIDNNDFNDGAGRVLDRVVSQNERISVYSFDINLDSLIIERLKEKYNVTATPTIIINDKHRMNWPFSVESVEISLE